MTRINVVEPSSLSGKHLMGEIHEITRVHGLVRKAQDRKINKYNFKEKVGVIPEYTMGKGHVLFFYNKLGYVTERYYALCNEAKARGYNVNPIAREELTKGIADFWMGSYTPTEQAIKVNQQRLDERMAGIKWEAGK